MRCALCGAAFACGMQGGPQPCWCADLPHGVPPLGPDANCLCPACLARALASPQGEGSDYV